MAAGFLSAPGTEYGPCEECSHIDCQATRDMAETICRLCPEPIGYDRAFFQEFGKVLVHATCAYAEAGGVNLMTHEEDAPMRCSSQHPNGRQAPIYEYGAATGRFRCEVCGEEYDPR